MYGKYFLGFYDERCNYLDVTIGYSGRELERPEPTIQLLEQIFVTPEHFFVA